jgi:hypothetical protein
MRWSFGFGPSRVYGGKSAASRRASTRRDAAAGAQAKRERQERRAREERLRVYNSPEAVAEREARKACTYRGTVSGCRIDPLKGGEFTVTGDDRSGLYFTVSPDIALQVMSLRNKDVVQVAVKPDGQGVEDFRHLARANGAEPRNPAHFPKDFIPGKPLH